MIKRIEKKEVFDWRTMEPDVLWYVVGLIATDGCLSPDGRHIDITAKDAVYLESVKLAAGFPQRVTAKYNGKKQRCHHIQIGSSYPFADRRCCAKYPRR